MEKKFIVTYMVPVTIKLTDHVVPKADEVIAALVKTARKMIMDKNFNPVHIEEAYEVISEDKARENEILGDIDKRSEADHDLGAAGRQDTDNGESLHIDECREKIGNDPGATSETRDESKDRVEDEGRLHEGEAK